MNFKVWMTGLAVVTICNVSQAAQMLICEGRYLTYKIHITANVNSDKQVFGKVRVAVKGPNLDTFQDLEVINSDIQPGRQIRVSGRNETGTGMIDAAKYNQAKDVYTGKMSGEGGSLGSLRVDVTCGIRNATVRPATQD